MLGCILYELCTLRRPFEGDSLNVRIVVKNKNLCLGSNNKHYLSTLSRAE
jgi:hypothetical protein